MEIIPGSFVEGTVSRITAFGAFVELGDGVSGLIHISEVANAYVKDVNDYLHVGDSVRVKVLSVEAPNKIGLSLKQAAAPEPEPVKRQPAVSPPSGECGNVFEDKLARFMKDSNEKQGELKRRQEGKKGR